MSNVRRTLSTPAVATTVSLYLFQSCVSISEGAEAGTATDPCWEGGACTGTVAARW